MPQAYSSAFARAYNLRWGFFARNAAPLLRSFYESTSLGLQNRTLLDLCCGTGVLSQHFLAHGYKVTGVDLSEPMLSYARQNTWEYLIAGQVRFIQADAADFSLDSKFGFVVSTFDAMNHLPNDESLGSCFKCVYDVLEQGGTFIFDLNTAHGLQQWNGMAVDDANPEALIINRGFIVGEENRAWTAITGFLKESDGRYTRFDEVAYNTIFKLSLVESLLRDTGFKQVHFAKGSDLSTPLEDPESEGRVFVVAGQT